MTATRAEIEAARDRALVVAVFGVALAAGGVVVLLDGGEPFFGAVALVGVVLAVFGRYSYRSASVILRGRIAAADGGDDAAGEGGG